MQNEMHNQVSRRAFSKCMRRWLVAITPAVVWFLAIGVSLTLYFRVGAQGIVVGFADCKPVKLAHLESGVIREVYVELHDQVLRGQALLALDDQEERIQLAGIETDIQRLRAEVAAEQARLTVDNNRAEADVEDLARRFSVDRETAHIEYLTQYAVDARERIELRGLLVEYEIIKDLYENGQAQFREINDIETEVLALQTRIEKNEKTLERLKQAFDDTDRRLFSFKQRGDVAAPYDPVLTPLRLAVDVRQHDLEEIVRRIDRHVLRAPQDGQVTALLAGAGDSVIPGESLVEISPNQTNRVSAYLPENMALSARVGASVFVHCVAAANGVRREYPGTIESLSATVNEAPQRYRTIPNRPVWGRQLVASIDQDVQLLPGEAVTLSFSD